MWSSIGRATARQVRVGGRLSMRTASRIAAHATPRSAPIIPSGIRVAAVFARGFAEASRPKKTATSTAATKKPAAKKTQATKTATKKTGTKKTATAKRPAAKKARAKKVLTEEQKLKRKIRELKKTALLKDEPTQLPHTSWMAFLVEQLKGTGESITTAMPKISSAYNALPASEVEKYEALAAQNRVANEINHKNWVESRTAHEIREANKARMLLRRKYNLTVKPTLDDPRYPKQALSAWVAFIKSRALSPDIASEAVTAKFAKLSAEWKQLGAEERKPFEEMAAVDSVRFKREMDEYHSRP